VHLQLLEYMVKIWRLHIKQHKKKPVHLPIVIPLLICHARKEWPEGTLRLTSLLSGLVRDLAGYILVNWNDVFQLTRLLLDCPRALHSRY
jgi:hypothetical protein